MSTYEALTYRPILHTIAYRIVGCTAIAEDMVQDTFFNWFKKERSSIEDTKAYLISSVRNLSLNHLKKKKTELLDSMTTNIPSFKTNVDYSYLDLKTEMVESLSVMFKKLPPADRAVFLLKEVFSFDYAELPDILDKTSDNCRQLFSRAQKKLAEEKERFAVDPQHLSSLMQDFKKATLGEFNDLIVRLKNDIGSK